MSRRVAILFFTNGLLFGVVASFATESSKTYTISLERSDKSGQTQIEYFLIGKPPHSAKEEIRRDLPVFGKPDRVDVPIEQDGTVADGLSAFVYQPGCQVTYLVIDDLKRAPSPPHVPCIPDRGVQIHIQVSNPEDLPGTDLLADFTYRGLREQTINEATFVQSVFFALGSFPIAPDGSLTVEVPDFGNDPALIKSLKNARFQITVLQKQGGPPVGFLVIPHEPVQRQMPVVPAYPPEIRLTFSTVNRFEGP